MNLPALSMAAKVAVLALVALGLLVGGVQFYGAQEQLLRQEIESRIQSIASLKAAQVVHWRQEHLADGIALSQSPLLQKRVARWLAHPNPSDAMDLLAELRTLRLHADYGDVQLLDDRQQVRLRLADDADLLSDEERRTVSLAQRQRRALLSDIHVDSATEVAHIDVIAPLFDGDGASARYLGALVLEADPNIFLLPIIESWPTYSQTAETALTRRDGDGQLVLNRLRFRSDAALRLRLPLDDPLDSRRAPGRAPDGVAQGLDYRGVEVMSVTKAIPDSPWMLVAKVDAAEAYMDWHRLSGLLVTLIAVLVGTCVAAIVYVHRAHQVFLAEATAKGKSEFLSCLSHEIRTPLHAIIGLANLLRYDTGDPEQRQKLDQLCASADHLLALVNNVLDLAKLEAQRVELHSADFRLGTVVDEVDRMVRGPARQKGLLLSVSADARVRDLSLHGDGMRLAQVLVNLCGNAVKYTDRGSVRLDVALQDERAEDVGVRFAVTDTGIGIAPEDQKRLFQSFVQARHPSARKRGGTGLGLAISQRLVGLMGGTIHVDSALGAGCRFHFELTLRRASAQAGEIAEVPVAAASKLHSRHVLLVEDDPLSQKILFEMLERLHCEVDAASDGDEAVERARADGYDLILMDMQMPRVDGVRATTAIRSLPNCRQTPIIALTANAFSEDRQRCLDAGMSGYLTKPVSPTTLAAAIGEWLADVRAPDADVAACDDDLTRALAAIEGLEVAETWRRSPELVASYADKLRMFVDAYGKDMARLRDELARGCRDEALAIVHNLSGAAGFVGARRISSLARAIVRELHAAADDASVAILAGDCEGELTNLAAAVRDLPGPPRHTAPAAALMAP